VTLGSKRRLRIAISVDSPTGSKVDPEQIAAAERAATLCRDLGHEVQAIACPFTVAQANDFMKLWAYLAFAQVKAAPLVTHRGFDPSKLERWSQEIARDFSRDMLGAFAGIRRLRRFAGQYATVMESWDVLLTPTLAQPPPKLGHLSPDQPFDELIAKMFAFTPFCALVNAAEAPALSLPLGRSVTGLPIGVQFAAAKGQERTLLELGLALEAAAPWPLLAPRPPNSAA
jgi:amidase